MRSSLKIVLVLVVLFIQAGLLRAQVVSSVVGGVAIDPDGALREATKAENAELAREMAKLVKLIPPGLDTETPNRIISLKKLNAEMLRCIEEKRDFSPAVCFLGGLTAIKYVVAVPEEKDILIIGPAEGWKIDDTGAAIGKNSGSPVLLLQDFITVFRAWNVDRQQVITCSIDPTPDAIAKTARVLSEPARQGEHRARAHALEQANGNHVVVIQGVPVNSRFAKVIVAADYKMKRIGLGHDRAPIRSIDSYISFINQRTKKVSITPRFWFAPEYATIEHDSKKLIWDLGGLKVKTLTEDEYVDTKSATRKASGKTDIAATRWCEQMNKNFDKLAKADPVFGDLKNCMSIAMTVALIHREGLLQKANCRIPAFTEQNTLQLPVYPTPKFVKAESVIDRNIVACGGVEINPWEKVGKSKLNNNLDKESKKLLVSTGDNWFLNAK